MQDRAELLRIYAYAREQMKKNGNPTQWGDTRPAPEVIDRGIAEGCTYVIVTDHIAGVFYFRIGEDETYRVIREGYWKSDALYGVIHRVASDGSERGIFRTCFAFCIQKIRHLRIDTHENNLPMQHAVKACGFDYRGIIKTDDGTDRLAYEIIL